MNARHWIAGEWTGTPTLDSIDPATGEAIGQYADGGAHEADAAIAAARHVFDRTTWAQDARLRQDVLLAWAAALDHERESLATLLTRENGKTIAQSRGEIAGAISEVRYYAGLARHIAGHVLEPEPGTISTMLREAAGVVAIIVPWNAPAVLLVRSLAPALAAGCTAIVKPAAQTSLVTAAMMRCFELTALPKGAVNLVNERGYAASERLADSHGVDVLSFTGSTATGKKIMARAAERLARVSMECGGKAPALVFADADLSRALDALTYGAFMYSGQSCTACTRLIVEDAVYDEVVDGIIERSRAMPTGDPMDAAMLIGPMASQEQYDKAKRFSSST